jgi:hypothetical protein
MTEPAIEKPQQFIEIVGDRNRETVRLDIIASVGTYAAYNGQGHYLRVIVGKPIISLEFFYVSEANAMAEYDRIREAIHVQGAVIHLEGIRRG